MFRTILLLLALSPAQIHAQEYKRSDWRHWSDFDRDCRDTRAETLIASSMAGVIFVDDKACTVLSGIWFDPYTGKLFTIARSLDLDHVIPLHYASEQGGWRWDSLTKKLFANDPENLLLVSATENRSKGSKGPSEYLPAAAYHCVYAQRWRMLSNKYELTLKAKDERTIEEILSTCP